MQVSVIATTELERRMTVQIPSDLIEKEVKNRLISLMQRVKLDGFRPGKIPFSVVQKKYGNQIRDEVKQDVVERTFRDAVKQEKLRLAGSPSIQPAKEDNGENLEFTATFEVFPDFEARIPDGVSIEKPVIEITDEDINQMVEKLRKQHVEYKLVERGAQMEDRLVIDFIGTIDGQPFSGGEAKQFALIIGTNTLIAGFEDGLLGIKGGETRELDVNFPSDYYIKELAGKVAHFKVNAHEVMEPFLPELNEKFFKSFDIKEGDLSTFREEIRKNMEREAYEAIKNRLKKQVFDVLLTANPIHVPKSLVDNEIHKQMQQFSEQLISRGVKESDIRLNPANFEVESRNRVQVGLILTDLIKRNNFGVTSEEVRTYIESVAATYDDSNEVITWYYQSKERLAGVEALLLEDKAVDLVLSHAQLESRIVNFADLMKSEAKV